MLLKKIFLKNYYYLINKRIEITKYIFVGLLSTILNFITYKKIFEVTNIIFLAYLVGSILGLINSYYFSKFWTFKNSRKDNKMMLLSYIIIHISGIGLSSLVTYTSNSIFSNYIFAWFCGAIFFSVYNYINLKKFTFKDKS
tara:strand:+ start:1583 stop:2005 length:423 start_codon:yes stop_codon:yes gene_type:complete